MSPNLKYKIFYSYFKDDQYGEPKSISRMIVVTATSEEFAMKIIEDKHLGDEIELESIIEITNEY